MLVQRTGGNTSICPGRCPFSLCSCKRRWKRSPFLLLVQEKRGRKENDTRGGRFRFLPNSLLRKLFALRCPVLIRKPARETIPFLLLVQEKGGKRTTQEGEDFDFFPLLTLLIETMKEGLIPSFKSPLRCAKREVFSLRTSLPAGAAAAAPERATKRVAPVGDGALDVPPPCGIHGFPAHGEAVERTRD